MDYVCQSFIKSVGILVVIRNLTASLKFHLRKPYSGFITEMLVQEQFEHLWNLYQGNFRLNVCSEGKMSVQISYCSPQGLTLSMT